jgi:hypothetical protein
MIPLFDGREKGIHIDMNDLTGKRLVHQSIAIIVPFMFRSLGW